MDYDADECQQLDADGCIRLLAAITRQWWQDARRNPRMLAELAEWLEMDVDELLARRPAKFRARSNDDADLSDGDEPPLRIRALRCRGAAYRRRGIGS